MDFGRCLNLSCLGSDPCRSQLREAMEEVRLVLVQFEARMVHSGTFGQEQLPVMDREMEDSQVMGTLDRPMIA